MSVSSPLPEEDRVIEGYFRCPTAFAVLTSALDRGYVGTVGGHRVEVSLPSANGVDMFNTDLQAPTWYYQGHDNSLSERPELAPFWGRIAIAGPTPQSPPKAVTVNRFRVVMVTTGDDDHMREVGRQVAEALTAWWGTVGAWIEVLFGQDFSRLGSRRAGVFMHEATMWAELFSLHGHPLPGGAILPVGSGAMDFVIPNFAPMNSAQFERCIAIAERLGMPRTEWLLIRDANSLCAGRDYRRAVLDAGLAAELTLTQLISDHLRARGHTASDVERVLSQNRMLGKRCQYWVNECTGTLPHGFSARLISRRNDATHAGHVPQEADAREAIDAARELVEQAFPIDL